MVLPFLFTNQVGGTAGISTEATNSMMQKFWDSAMALTSNEDEEDARRLFTCNCNIFVIVVLFSCGH